MDIYKLYPYFTPPPCPQVFIKKIDIDRYLSSGRILMFPSLFPPSRSLGIMLVWQQMTDTSQSAQKIQVADRRKTMRYELTNEWPNEMSEEPVLQDMREEADSFGEFAQALLISLAAILAVGVGTYLVFTGIVASLLSLMA